MFRRLQVRDYNQLTDFDGKLLKCGKRVHLSGKFQILSTEAYQLFFSVDPGDLEKPFKSFSQDLDVNKDLQNMKNGHLQFIAIRNRQTPTSTIGRHWLAIIHQRFSVTYCILKSKIMRTFLIYAYIFQK